MNSNLILHARSVWQNDRYDRMAMHALSALPGHFLPWSWFAMRPGALLAVLTDIQLRKRSSIVECGGGISTVYIGRLLKQLNFGSLTTIEHDGEWVAFLRRALAAEGLEYRVRVVHAPLSLGEHGEWYASAAIPVTRDVDLLIVDGPTAHTPETRLARYAALPHFAPSLAPGASVILDDIVRTGEQEISASWERAYPIKFDHRLAQGGIAFGIFGDCQEDDTLVTARPLVVAAL